MYPGVGPDGVYRLHAGLNKGGNALRGLNGQLEEGGNKLNDSVRVRMRLIAMGALDPVLKPMFAEFQ